MEARPASGGGALGGHDAPTEAPEREQAPPAPDVRLEYDPVESRLFRVDRDAREEVALPPQLHRLVEHAAERNRAAGGRHVLCAHDELIAVLWGDGNGTPQALAIVIHELRERLGPAHAALVENVRGRGYRLALSVGAPSERAAGPPTPGDPPSARRPLSPLVGLAAAVVLGVGVALGLAFAQANAYLPPSSPTLRIDSHGDDVLRLQLALAEVGFDPGPADGWFGPATARALRGFQLSHQLVADGEYGPNSRAALLRELAQRRAVGLAPVVLALGVAAAVPLALLRRRRAP
jgi:DNA-binding winged helix-turn-helix (wHTH) protein